MKEVVRLRDFPKLEAAILQKVYHLVKDVPKDGQWREFKGKVMVKGRPYDVNLTFRLDGQFMQIEKSHVENFEQKLILPASIH